MLGNLEEMQKAGRLQFETANRSALVFLQGAQRIASEAVDHTRAGVDHCTQYMERLATAKSVEDAIRAQAEFTRQSIELLFSGATRMADCYAAVARDVAAPAKEPAGAAASRAG